jgi:hypothetical protein
LRNPATSIAVALVLALVALPAEAQQEQGDVELQFNGSILTTVGQEGRTFTSGIFQFKGGYFVTDRVELGAFPSVVFQRTRVEEGWEGETESATKLGMGVFANYSFLAEDAVTVPYVGLQGYRIDLTDEDETGWVGLNAGMRFYFSRRTAFDVGGNVLMGLGDAGGALVLFQMGLSFLL